MTACGIETSDILDSSQAEQYFNTLHLDALANPGQIEKKGEALMEQIRSSVSQQSRQLVQDQSPRDQTQTHNIEQHPIRFWIEKLVTSAVRAEGGRVEKKLTGWDIYWADGSEMKNIEFTSPRMPLLTTDSSNTSESFFFQSLLSYRYAFAPGMAIPSFTASGLPASLEGTWSLWEITLIPSFSTEKPLKSLVNFSQRVFPLFINLKGRSLWTSARSIWDWFLRSDAELQPNGVLSEIDYEQLNSLAENEAEKVCGELSAAYQKRLNEEKKRSEFNFVAQQKEIERIGLEEVRKYRHRELEIQHQSHLQQMDLNSIFVPRLTPVVVIGIKGGK